MVGTVCIIGAGFSRAISESMGAGTDQQMPLLGDLLRLLRRRMDVPDLGPFNEDLEQWLSHLAAEQPWLSDVENLHNQAVFAEASEHIGSIIAGIEQSLTWPGGDPPAWLTSLAGHWSERTTAVVTFNYDTLVERILHDTIDRYGWEEQYAAPLVLPSGQLADNNPDPQSWRGPRVFKLHGSVNWRYSGLKAGLSDPIYLLPTVPGWQQNKYSKIAYETQLQHKHTMIVPPTGIKVGFYANEALRHQWRQAAKRIAGAEEVVILGYSMPPTDTLVRAMLASSYPKEPCRLTIVNRGGDLAKDLKALLPTGTEIDARFSGDDAIKNYVADLTGS